MDLTDEQKQLTMRQLQEQMKPMKRPTISQLEKADEKRFMQRLKEEHPELNHSQRRALLAEAKKRRKRRKQGR